MADMNNLDLRFTEIITSYFPNESDPGCGVLILSGDDTRYFTRGMGNIELSEPVTEVTNFRLASVSKQFTATCILQLRENGSLRLDQSVRDFLPDFPSYGSAITVEHLLRHTSGVKDYEPLVAGNDYPEPVMDREVRALLAHETETDFLPGSRFRYSNSGYALLAQIIEQVSGQTFPAYVEAYIFRPLGMDSSVVYVNRPGFREVPNRAMGYAINSEGHVVLNDQSRTSSVLGDGGVYTSLVDYEKWIRAYMDGKVLTSPTVMDAWTPALTINGETIPYGYGWRLEMQEDRWLPYHPGSTTGFRNGVLVDPEKRLVVLVITNRSGGDSIAVANALMAELKQPI